MKNPYEEYYLRQAGSGIPVVIGNRHQRGHGIGNILGGLARMVVPILKRGGQTLLKEGVRAGVDILGDVVSGGNIKESAKRRAKQTGKRLLDKASTSLSRGSPPGEPVKKQIKSRTPPGRRHSKQRVKRGKVRSKSDIFG